MLAGFEWAVDDFFGDYFQGWFIPTGMDMKLSCTFLSKMEGAMVHGAEHSIRNSKTLFSIHAPSIPLPRHRKHPFSLQGSFEKINTGVYEITLEKKKM